MAASDDAFEAKVSVLKEETEGELREAGNPRDAVPSETDSAAPI